jgi:uncharacterized protein (TIGR02147 family)
MDVFQANNYRLYIEAIIKPNSGRVWGAVKRLSEVLKCHSTYVSQIINGKADLSTEQTVAICKFFGLDAEETDHFHDLVNRDKAGNEDTTNYFQTRINKRLEERLNLKKRFKVDNKLSLEQEAIYYRGWLPQAVHMACTLSGNHSSRSIAQLLGVSETQIALTLNDLKTIGLVELVEEGYRASNHSVHLGNDSPMIHHFHTNWRFKAAQDIMTSATLPGVHYSSVATMSQETAKELHQLILSHVERSRALIAPSPSEIMCLYSLDFYPLSSNSDPSYFK